jgi:hypothetical protein
MVNDVTKSAYVELYEDYHYMFYGSNKMGLFHMIDSATCVVRAFSNGDARVTDVTNPDPWSDWPDEDRNNKCRLEYPSKKNWKGLVQIDRMTKAYGAWSGDSMLSFQLTLRPTTGNTPQYIEHCKKGTRTVRSNVIPAQPEYIAFVILPDGHLHIAYKGKDGTDVLDGIGANDEGCIIRMYRKP